MGYRPAQSGLPPAIILGGPVTGMVVARSLFRAGVRVIALGTQSDHFGRSRCCHKAVAASAANTQPEWLAWLLSDDAPEGAVVIAASDEGMELIARNRDALVARGLRPAESHDEAVLALLDKQRTYEIADAAGVLRPRTHDVHSAADVGPELDGFRFPCGLKPLHRHVFERCSPIRDKVIVANDPAELHRLLGTMLDLGLAMQVTEIVPGRDDQILVHTTYLDEQGEPLMEFTHRKLRQNPVQFGVGCYVRGEWLPDVAREGLRFAQAAGVRGMAVTEFKQDPRDGTLRLIECNARFNLAVALLRTSGFDLGLLSYRRTLGLPGPDMGPAQYGRHLWHPLQDLRSALEYRRRGELTGPQWIRSLLRRQDFSLFALDDPWPSTVEVWAGTGRALAHARRGLGTLRRRLRQELTVRRSVRRPALSMSTSEARDR